jgi:hypothetical protein
MKRLTTVVVASFVALSTQIAFAQGAAPARFQQVVEINAKPGSEAVFENYIKKLVAAADKVSAKQTWTTYAVTLGKAGGTYRVAVGFNSWADRDGWSTIPMILAKAYGQPEAERLMKESGSATERMINEVWENLPDLGTTASAAAGSPPPIGVRVQVTRVQPAASTAYEAMLAKFRPAYQAAAGSPGVGRSVLRMGPGSGSTYRRTQQFAKWSDLDGPGGGAILQKHFGPQFPAMLDELRKMIVNQQEFISVRRAELSRTGTVTATR